MLQVGRRGSSSPGKASLVPACFSPTGLGLLEALGDTRWGLLRKDVPPSREAEGTGCPSPHRRLEPSPATAPRPTAAHTGGRGSNTQPRVLLCRRRNTPEDRFFCCCFS